MCKQGKVPFWQADYIESLDGGDMRDASVGIRTEPALNPGGNVIGWGIFTVLHLRKGIFLRTHDCALHL